MSVDMQNPSLLEKSKNRPNWRFKGRVAENSPHHAPRGGKIVLQRVCNGLVPLGSGIRAGAF